MLSKASNNVPCSKCKRVKMGDIYDMFDVKFREGVGLGIARFFFTCGISFNVLILF